MNTLNTLLQHAVHRKDHNEVMRLAWVMALLNRAEVTREGL